MTGSVTLTLILSSHTHAISSRRTARHTRSWFCVGPENHRFTIIHVTDVGLESCRARFANVATRSMIATSSCVLKRRPWMKAKSCLLKTRWAITRLVVRIRLVPRSLCISTHRRFRAVRSFSMRTASRVKLPCAFTRSMAKGFSDVCPNHGVALQEKRAFVA